MLKHKKGETDLMKEKLIKFCRKKNLFGGPFNEIAVWSVKYKVKTYDMNMI